MNGQNARDNRKATLLISIVSNQGYTNPGGQVPRKKKFPTVAPKVSVSSIWKSHLGTVMEPKIYEVARTFSSKICASLFQIVETGNE
jgi:hypothetical protein